MSVRIISSEIQRQRQQSPALFALSSPRAALALAFWWLVGCEPKLVIGTWSCPTTSSVASAGSSGVSANFVIPWSTGFENGFCDYAPPSGHCYPHGEAEFEIVDEPVHSGRHAAAFTVTAGGDTHTRCYRQGVLPRQAFYEAWYYVPAFARNGRNWNLFHYQVHRRGTASTFLEHLWDVSLVNDDADGLRLSLWSALPDFPKGRYQGEIPPIPIGKWFQIGVWLKLAADTSGEIAVYQDGTLYLQLTELRTDWDDSEWGQWYIGNLADALDPPRSTVYVDDVSVRASR